MGWQRARNMDRLRSDALTVWPGMTIWDIGDLAHARGRSGHNPDDMVLPQGGSAELSDPDSKQEVRALDFMLGPRFTEDDAEDLVAALRDPRSRPRLYYVIYNRRIYRRDGSDSPYGGDDPHTNHVHASGWWEDDENTAAWAAVLEIGDDMTPQELINTKLGSPALGDRTVGDWWKQGEAARREAAAAKTAAQGAADKADAVAAKVDELLARPPAGAVTVDDAQLARVLEPVLRKILGGVDGATPAE